MTNEMKKYCEGLDCAICDEKEPCIYKIANELQEKLLAKEQECHFNTLKIIALQEALEQYETENDQLKRKEQELQEAMDNYVKLDNQRVKEYNELVNRYTDKEQECEELKETFDGLFKVQYKLADNNKKLRQCLTEIKEIAEKNLNIHTCAFKGCGYDLITNQILQKISEVESVGN